MDVKNAPMEGREDVGWNEPEKSGQHDKSNPILFQQPEDPVTLVKLLAVEYDGRDPVVFGPFKNKCIRFVGKQYLYCNGCMSTEMVDDVFRVGTGT